MPTQDPESIKIFIEVKIHGFPIFILVSVTNYAHAPSTGLPGIGKRFTISSHSCSTVRNMGPATLSLKTRGGYADFHESHTDYTVGLVVWSQGQSLRPFLIFCQTHSFMYLSHRYFSLQKSPLSFFFVVIFGRPVPKTEMAHPVFVRRPGARDTSLPHY